MTSIAVKPSLGRLWQVPVFCLGVATAIFSWGTQDYWSDSGSAKVNNYLYHARDNLESSSGSAVEAASLASEALTLIERSPGRQGEAHFLLGSALLRRAEQTPPEQSKDCYRTALDHLRQAEAHGVALADRPLLYYRLGMAYYGTAAEWDQAIRFLKMGLDQLTSDRFEGYGLLGQAYLRLPQPDVRAALDANEKQLQQPTLNESLLAPARLFRAELYLRLQDRDRARKALTQIDATAPDEIFGRAQFLLARIYQDEEDWEEAARLWQSIVKDKPLAWSGGGEALYFLGVCYRNLGRGDEALAAWRYALCTTPESRQAAALQAGELLRLRKTGLFNEVNLYLASWFETEALVGISTAEEYRNPYLSIAQVKSLIESCCRGFLEKRNFAWAKKLANLHARIVPPNQGLLLLGQIAEGEAMFCAQRARNAKEPAYAERLNTAASSNYRDAASKFELAAQFAVDKKLKGELYHEAATNHLRAKDFKKAVVALDAMLVLPLSDEVLGGGWYDLALAHRAVRNEIAANEAFKHCIELNQPPFTFRARYQLAAGQIARKEFVAAQESLSQNLALMQGKTDPEAHELSLYALADLFYQRENYSRAVDVWKDALTYYPKNPRAPLAQFQMADSYDQLAFQHVQNTNTSSLLESMAELTRRQAAKDRENAKTIYRSLIRTIGQLTTLGPLPKDLEALGRDARFRLADNRYWSGDYEESIQIYIDLKQLYRNQIHELKAIEGIMQCYISLKTHDAALATITSMEEALSAMDDKAFEGLEQKRKYWTAKIEKFKKDIQILFPVGSPK